MEKKNGDKTKKNVLFYKIAFCVLLVLLLIYIFFFSNIIKRDCGNDARCFDSFSARCIGTKVELLNEDSLYKYTIHGPIKSDCVVEAKLQKVAPGTPANMRDKLEGKTMMCRIPKDLLKEKGIADINDLIPFCSGTLKEGFYEAIIDEMYSLIIKNMANITKTVEKDILK